LTVPVGVAEERIPARQDAALLARVRMRLDAYLAAAPGAEVRSLAELVEFNRSDPVELSLFGQENFEHALELPDLDPAAFALHQAMRRSAARSAIDALLAEHHLDAIVTLSNGAAPAISYGGGDGPEILTTTPAAVAGYPMVTVPAGFLGALPVGVTFIGSAGSDAALLRLAGAFESAVGARRPPALPVGA
jgi:amidase